MSNSAQYQIGKAKVAVKGWSRASVAEFPINARTNNSAVSVPKVELAPTALVNRSGKNSHGRDPISVGSGRHSGFRAKVSRRLWWEENVGWRFGANVRFGSKAAIPALSAEWLLCAKSGHSFAAYRPPLAQTKRLTRWPLFHARLGAGAGRIHFSSIWFVAKFRQLGLHELNHRKRQAFSHAK